MKTRNPTKPNHVFVGTKFIRPVSLRSSRHHLVKQLAAIGLSVAAGCFAASATAAPADASAAKTIRVLSAAGVDAASPQATIWRKAPATQVTLQPAFPGHASIVGTPITERMIAQAVRAGDRLFVRLAWTDRTADTVIDNTNKFADGAAVQFPVNGKPATSPFMGDARAVRRLAQRGGTDRERLGSCHFPSAARQVGRRRLVGRQEKHPHSLRRLGRTQPGA